MSDSVSCRRCRAALHGSPGNAPRNLGRCATAGLLLLLGACHHAMPVDSASSPRAVVQFSRLPEGGQPQPLRRVVSVSTERPLSLRLRVGAGEPLAARPHAQVELGMLDARGVPTQEAVIRPASFVSDADGYSPPLTFLASAPGTYLIRVVVTGVDADGLRIAVHSDGAR